MQNSVAKKLFAVGSAAAMALAMGAPFAVHAAAHAAGTNVSTSDGTVWMIMPDGTRRAYTSAGAFLSYGFNSWAQVVPANSDDAALPQGSFIPPQDGSIVCSDRGRDKGTCYEISGGQKFGFTSAAVFTGLGFSFANAPMADVSWMTMNPTLLNSASMAHEPGTLVNNNGTVQLVGTTGMLGIPDLATFNSWGYSFGKVVPANAADKAMTQTGVMAARTPGQLSPTALSGSGNPGNPVVVSGPISAMLASDNPAGGTVIQTQASADMLHLTFTGSGSLSGVTLKRIGVSPNTSVDNVYLYQGAHRLSDGASVNSTGMVMFAGLNIPVNGSLTLSVRADIDSTAPSGNSLGFALVSYTPSGNAAVTANLQGNLFSIASSTNVLGTANFTGTITANPPSSATVNAGSTGYTFWSDTMNVTTHAMWLQSANFQVIGSAPQDALQNVGFYVDGVQAGTSVAVQNGYAFFDFTGNPVNLTTGSHTLEVRADVQKGSNRTVQFALQNAADLMITDSQVNVNVAPTVSSSTFSPLSANSVTISQGTLSAVIDPSFQSLTTATGGGTNQVIARYKFHAYGEDLKIMTLVLTPSVTSTNQLNNVTLYFGSGTSSMAQVGPQKQWTGSGTLSYTLGSSLVVPAGQDSFLEVHADLQDNNNNNLTSGTVTVTLNFASWSAQGLSSLNTTSILPSGTLATTGLTIQTGALSVGKSSYANQTLSPNAVGQKIGEFTLQNQSSSEAVRVTNLAVKLYGDSGPTNVASGTLLTNMSNLHTDETSGSGSQPVQPVGSGNNFPVNFTLAPGASKTIGVYVDLSTLSSGTIVATMLPTAYGVSSNVTLTPGSASNGQTITLSAGSFGTPAFQASPSSVAQFVAAAGGNSTGTHNVFNFTATNGTANITELKFVVKDAAAGTVSSVNVSVGGTAVATNVPVVTPQSTTLSTGTTSVATTLTLASVSGISAGSVITIASTTATTESVLVTAVSGNTVTVQRSAENTSAIAHSSGEVVKIQGMAYVTGLNIAVPNGASGVNVDVVPTYSNTGTNGVTSGTTSQVELTYDKRTLGGTTSTDTYLPGASNGTGFRSTVMTVVGSKPVVTVPTPNTTAVPSAASTEVLDFTIAADPKGDITASSVPITVGLTGASTTIASASTSNVAIYTSTDNSTNLASSNTAFGAATGGTSTVTFTNGGYRITAGTSVTFRVFLTLTGITSGTNGTSVATNLATGTGFAWADTAAGNAAFTGTTNILGYPSNTTVVIHN